MRTGASSSRRGYWRAQWPAVPLPFLYPALALPSFPEHGIKHALSSQYSKMAVNDQCSPGKCDYSLTLVSGLLRIVHSKNVTAAIQHFVITNYISILCFSSIHSELIVNNNQMLRVSSNQYLDYECPIHHRNVPLRTQHDTLCFIVSGSTSNSHSFRPFLSFTPQYPKEGRIGKMSRHLE